MKCEKHPKYNGLTDIKRLDKCDGCKKVRQAYIISTKERKNKGKGSQFSITTPGFRCGVGHLLCEIGAVVLYGQQPEYFWRKGVPCDPRAKKHYEKTYNMLAALFKKDEGLYNSVKKILWLIWEDDFHKISQLKQNSELEKFEKNEDQKVIKQNVELFKNTRINYLKYGDDNAEEEENRSF